VKLLVAGYLALLVNSSYLAAYAEQSLFYFGNVVLHMGLGVGPRPGGDRLLRSQLQEGSVAVEIRALAVGTELALRIVHDALWAHATVPLGAHFSYRDCGSRLDSVLFHLFKQAKAISW
jgi:hypothetical protein